MATWANNTKNSATFANQQRVSGYDTLGNRPISEYENTAFDDTIATKDSEKTLENAAFDDTVRVDIFNGTTKHTASFINETKH